MGRRKVPMGLIPVLRTRASTFAKRKEGLRKKANELSVLCGVEVALVVAPPAADAANADAGAAADVWESKEGVLARYRALDPEVRARHTFREYLYAELGKEEAKLARVRQAGPDGLDCWDKALDGVDTVDEAQRLLDAVDAAIRAADDRRRALGMPVDDDDDNEDGAGTVLQGIAPLGAAASAAVDGGYLLNALGGNGDAANDQAGFHPYNMQYGLQQYNIGNGAAMEGYDIGHGHGAAMEGYGMYHNSGLATDAYGNGAMQDGYGFPCASAIYFGVPSGYQQMQQVVGVGGGAAAQPNLLAMSSADEPCHTMVPVPVADTSLNYMDTQEIHGGTSFAMDARGNFLNAPPAFSVAMTTGGGGGGGNFIGALPPAAPSSQTMGGSGIPNGFTRAQPLAMSYGGDMTVAGRYATQSAMEQPHYLGDLEDTQPNPWGN